MKWHTCLKQTLAIILTAAIFTTSLASVSFADDTSVPDYPAAQTGCNYAQNPMCVQLLGTRNGLGPEGAEAATAFCKANELNDKFCTQDQWMTIVFGIMSGVCVLACAGGWFPSLAWTIPYCLIGSIGAMLGDMVWGIVLTHNTQDNFVKANMTKMAHDMAIGPAAAGAALVAAGIVANLVSGYGSAVAGSVTAAENAGMEGGMVSESAATTTGSSLSGTATTTVTGTGANGGAQTATSSSTTTLGKIVVCATAGLDIAMTVIKGVDKVKIEDASKSNWNKLCDQDKYHCKDPTNSNPLNIRSAPTRANSASSGTVPPSSLLGDGSTKSDPISKKVDDAYNSGDMAARAAQAEPGKLFGNDPKAFQKTFGAMASHGGPTPGQFAQAAADQGIGAAIAGLLPEGKVGQDIGAMAKEMEKKARAYIDAHPGGFEGSATVASGKSVASPFGNMFGSRDPAGAAKSGAHDVSFGGFNGDIWHAGTTKTIFEIVSDKTKSVFDRVGN